MAEGSNYVIAILLDAKDKNLKKALQDAGQHVDDFTDKAEDSGSRIQKAFVGAGIAMAFGEAIPFMKQSIGLYNEMRASLVGLQSVVRYTNQDWATAQAALHDYTADGLVPMTNATVSLKNLLLRGFGLEQAVKIMERFKDFAAFGKQGSLTMGQAIQGASEGLKNMNPILVDNVGLTKNMSIMYKDYAKTLGTSAAKLTDAQRLQAEYQGIMQEGEAVVGNAAKLQGELGGKMAATEARTRRLKEAVGGALAPAYGTLLDQASPAVDAITASAEAAPEATTVLLGGSGLVAAVAALSAAFALIGTGGAIVVGAAAGILGIATAATALRAKLDPSADSIEKTARRADDLSSRVRELRVEYGELEGKPDKSEVEHRRLKKVMEELARLVPEAVKAFSDEGEVLELNISRLDEYVRAMEVVRDMEIEKYEEKVTEAQRERERVQDKLSSKLAAYDAMLQHGITTTREFTGTVVEGGEELYSMSEEMVSSELSIDGLRRQIRGLAADLREAEKEEKRTKKTLAELRGELGGETGGAGGEDGTATGSAAEADTEKVYGLLDAMKELTGWAMEQEGIPASLLMRPKTLEEAVQWYKDYMAWIEGLRDDAAERDEERDAEALETKRAALEAYYRTAKGKLDRLTKEWDDLSDVGVRMAHATSDALGAALGTILSGTADTAEKLQQIWDSFINWLWMELGRIIARLIMTAILKAFIAPVPGDANFIGPLPLGRQRGGEIPGPTRGYDYIPTLLDGGETVLSVDLTRRVERMVNDWEAWRSPTRAVAMAEGYEAGVPVVTEEHYHFHSVDFSSFDRALRGGQLGEALRRTVRHGRLRR